MSASGAYHSQNVHLLLCYSIHLNLHNMATFTIALGFMKCVITVLTISVVMCLGNRTQSYKACGLLLQH